MVLSFSRVSKKAPTHSVILPVGTLRLKKMMSLKLVVLEGNDKLPFCHLDTLLGFQ